MTDPIFCPWCSETTDIGGLVGVRQSLCPCCGQPVLSAPFGALKDGAYFLCDLGGKWEKTGVSDATCVEDDAAYCIGDAATFTEDSPVYPFRVADMFPSGTCPDCEEEIPLDAVSGSDCSHCGHVLTVVTQTDLVC